MSGETRDSGGVRFDFTGWVGNSLIGFLSKSLVFCEGKSDSFGKKSESLLSLFCHERPEQFAHGCSVVESNLSDSLTVALL